MLQRETVDLRPVFRVTVEVFRNLIGDRPVRFVNQLPNNLSGIYADENRLKQILYNSIQPIVENAVRHGVMKRLKGGTVKITVKPENGFAIITVEDNGLGISEEKLKALLEGNPETGGVGLRNIHWRMKNLYGYGLQIESDVGKGTKVII